MAGLDKIIGEIRSESDSVVKEILDKATKEADEIRAKAEKEAGDTCERIRRESNTRLSDMGSRAESAAALAKRQLMLSEKQDIIREVIDKAKEEFYNMSDANYFDTLLKLVKKNAMKGEGQIIFNEKDKKRLPANFATALSEAAKAAGGTLSVSNETRNIDGGFVLSYGGVEQNCSVSVSPFNTCCKADLVVPNSLNFCLSK